MEVLLMRSASRLLIVAAILATLLPGRADAATGWSEEVVGKLPGAAFSMTADLDGDRRKEILVSSFGKVAGFGPTAGGTIAIYRAKRGGGWSRTDLVKPSDGIQFPNEPTVTDVNGDGRVDVIVPGGFFICVLCGSLSWWEQKAGGTWARHDLVAVGNPLFFHGAQVVDMNGDGKRDLVTVGETAVSATTMMFAGTGTGFSTVPTILGEGLGALPVVTDVDGDRDLDIASAQYFSRNGSFAWLENLGGVFVKHLIAADLGGSIQLSRVPGIGWVGSNHTNTTSGPPGTPVSGLYLLTPGPDPRLPWTSKLISSGIVSRSDTALGQQQGAPGVFGWGDVDGDGDTDLAVSGDGDRRLFVVRQVGRGSFRTEVVADQRGQAGGGKVLGRKVLFSSYDAGLVALYRKR
jgi:hypothetical protein